MSRQFMAIVAIHFHGGFRQILAMKNRIEELRRARRLSMEALGEAVGTSASQINKLEKG